MKVGLEGYKHEVGECYTRKVAELDGPCGDPRCNGARNGYLDAMLGIGLNMGRLGDSPYNSGYRYGHLKRVIEPKPPRS